MPLEQSFKSWYNADDTNQADIAQKTFNSIKKHLRQSSALSNEEKDLLERPTSLQDVQNVVTVAFARYETKNQGSKIRKLLEQASESVCHYSKVLDVFVQHHPEYVSLAWGLMNLLFIGVVNHGETLKLLVKSLHDVSRHLPRIEFLSKLYATERMRLGIEGLYSCIMEFLLIAHAWCRESKFRHVYHSLTRPHELRYGELLERITTHTNDISELAAVGAKAELRIMHDAQSEKLDSIIKSLQTVENTRKAQFDGLTCALSRLETSNRDNGRKLDLIMQWLEASGLTINDLLTNIEASHSIQTSAQLDTNQALSAPQLSQALSTFSQQFEDPDQLYKNHLFLRNRRASGRGSTTSTNEFWLSSKLSKWSSSQRSSLAIIRGSFTTRWAIQDFAVDVIQAVTISTIPALWALGSTNKARKNAMFDTRDLMRYLICQALQLDGTVTTEKQISVRRSQLENAKSLGDWFDLLKLIIQNSKRQIYLIVDLATVHSCGKEPDEANFIHQLSQMLSEVSEQKTQANIKIILLAYEVDWLRLIPKDVYDRLVPVKITGSRALQGKKMRQAVNTRVLPRKRGKKKV